MWPPTGSSSSASWALPEWRFGALPWTPLIADVAFLWLASIPLGYVSGIVLGLPIFITTVFLRIDDIIKSVWCIGRLNSGKWIHNVVDKKESGAEKQ